MPDVETGTQITDVNLVQAHCLPLQTPTLDFFHENSPKAGSSQFKNESELQNSNLNFLLYCYLKWNNKANRGELVFTKVFHAIQ
jgi:hypothetical protein